MEDLILNSLSNEDLKYRLTQYGFPNLPVTNTTRKLFIKKLKNHLEDEKSKLRRDTAYATRYSSDEDLTQTDKERQTKKRGALPRSTIAGVPQQSKYFRTDSMPAPAPSILSPISVKRNQTTTWGTKSPSLSQSSKTSVYVSPLIQSGGSESDDDLDSKSNSGQTSISSRKSINVSGSSFGSLNGPENDEGDGSPHHSALDTSTNGFHGKNVAPNDFTKRLMSFRNRNLGSTIPSAATGTAGPHLSANRFSRFHLPLAQYQNDIGVRPRGLPRDTIVYQAHNIPTTKKPNNTNSFFTNFVQKLDEQYGVKQSCVPFALLSTLFVFFALVAAVYITMSPDMLQALDPSAATFKLCPKPNDVYEELGDEFIRTYNCIDEVDLDSAFALLKVLIPELQTRIVAHRCKDASVPFAINAKEVIRLVVEDRPKMIYDTMHSLHNAEYLIAMNPQWHVAQFADKTAIKEISIEEIAVLRESQMNYFAIINPRLPWTCILYNKLQTFFVIVGCIALGVSLLYLCIYIYKAIAHRIKTRRDRLNNLIEDITNVLMQKAYDPDTAATDAASVVINHLRDKLIPPNERNSMESTWNDAVRYLEQNESRIQFSIATRNGEDHRVMRWVDTSMPTSHRQSSSTPTYTANPLYPRLSGPNAGLIPTSIKKWQSPAFDKTNKIKDPPTECLKIRQMFDKYEAGNPNLKQTIQDAILEKLAHTSCRIYDIQLEKNTCCVYVRCATAADAGLVHDEINGWWFDSRLVSIKFLRMDRFLNRFPQSISTVCLKPSNSNNLSMANQINANDGDNDDDYFYNDSD